MALVHSDTQDTGREVMLHKQESVIKVDPTGYGVAFVSRQVIWKLFGITFFNHTYVTIERMK